MRAAAVAGLVIAGGVLIGIGEMRAGLRLTGLQDRTGMERIADALRADAERRAEPLPRDPSAGVSFLIYVYAEPAVVYHLAARGVVAPPAGTLEFAADDARRSPVPVFLVTGPHADRSADFARQWQTARDRFEPVAEYEYLPSDLVALNLADRVPLTQFTPRRETVRLYRLK